jgi:hypothetical protein
VRAEQRAGEMACADDRAEAEGAEGVQRKKKGKRKLGTKMENFESLGVYL